LETRSKDLQIAAWLAEAWLHLHGFSGTAAGFELMHALCERYWEELHPRIDAQDPDFRNAPLIWLNRKLPVKLKLRPITAPQSGDVPPFSWADWEVACQADHAASKAKSAEEMKHGPSLAAFQQSVRLTPAPHLRDLLNGVEQTILYCGKLESLLDERLQKDSPGLVAIRSTSEDIAGLLSSLLRERTTLETSEELAHLAAHMQESGESEAIYPRALIRTRGEAYALLAEIADFLEQTEPHSPTPHLLRRAVNWGSLPFAQLLPELIRNQSELSEIARLLSLKTSSATNG
jgi:type VI secretion system protein ImpA